MRKTKEILRLKFGLGLSHREVGRSLGVSAGTVGLAVRRAERAGVGWEEAATMSEEALEGRLYAAADVTSTRPLPDFARLHAERRRAGVTMLLLHQEYLEREATGYGYSQFCEFYRRWLGKRGLTMRQVHIAGEKLFVDYSGKRPHFIDPDTGERVDVELFVAVLGASNYTFAEATRTQQGPDWIASHVRAFAFFGGITRAVVPDQLKSGVTTPCRYEPGIQRTYAELAMHYDTSILPPRRSTSSRSPASSTAACARPRATPASSSGRSRGRSTSTTTATPARSRGGSPSSSARRCSATCSPRT